MTEKGGDPEHISRVLEGFEHEHSQERGVDEGKDKREREGVDQDGLGIIRWFDNDVEIVRIHGHNERNEGA